MLFIIVMTTGLSNWEKLLIYFYFMKHYVLFTSINSIYSTSKFNSIALLLVRVVIRTINNVSKSSKKPFYKFIMIKRKIAYHFYNFVSPYNFLPDEKTFH